MNKFLKIVGAVAVINIIARIFGFAREMVIGFQYGSGYISDSIFTAYMFPNFLYLVVGGAFTTAVISIYTRKTTNRELFVKQSFTIVVLTVSVLTVLTLVFTQPLLEMLNSNTDTSADADLSLARHLFYWMMPSSILLVLSSWYSGLLNVNSKYHLSSFAILVYNLFFVIISLGLSYVIGPIAYGVSALVSAVIMIYFLIEGYRKLDSYPIGISFVRSEATKQLWIMVLPMMFGGATIQLYALIQRLFASMLSEGSISAVNYASKLTQFPQVILITAVTTVIYPILSQKEASDDHESIKSLYAKGLHSLLLLLAPVTVFSFFYSKNLVQVIFEYGNFNEYSTSITTPIMEIFVLSMYFLAATTYITRFYYAKGDSIAPVIFSLLNVFGVNIAVIMLFVDAYGATAIAWGTLISAIVNYLMLVVYAHYKYDLKLSIFTKHSEVKRVLPALIVTTLVVYLSSKYFVFDYKWITFLVGVSIFMGVVVGTYLLMGIKEFKELFYKLFKRATK